MAEPKPIASLKALHSCSEIRMEVEAQIDRTTLTVRQILELAPDSVIPLERSAGEHIDLLVGGALVARGEIVPFKGKAAIRIAEFREEA